MTPRIEIVKVYDASNAHEASELISNFKRVIFGINLKQIYENEYQGNVYAYRPEIECYRLQDDRGNTLDYPYIAEFREVEDEI
jgi:hypothetical protein